MALGIRRVATVNIEAWLIRHDDPTDEHFNTVWSMSIIRGAASALVVSVIAYPAAILFNEPRLTHVILLFAIAIFITACENVGMIFYQRQLQLRYLAVQKTIGRFAGVIVTVLLAFYLKNYWALVFGLLAQNISSNIVSYAMHKYRPRFSLNYWREAFDYSKWLLGSNILDYIYKNFDRFFIGRVIGSSSLGVYSIAHEVANAFTTEVVRPAGRALFPAYSKLKNEHSDLAIGFITGYSVFLVIGLPIASGIGLLAEPLVHVVLGSKWLDAIPLIQVLVVYSITTVGISNQGPALMASGHVKQLLGLMLFATAVLIPLAYLGGTQHGAIGVAVAVSFSNVVLFLVGLVITAGVLKIRIATLLDNTYRPVIAVIAMSSIVIQCNNNLIANAFNSLSILVICTLIGAGVYIASIYLLWRLARRPPGAEGKLLQIIVEKMGAT